MNKRFILTILLVFLFGVWLGGFICFNNRINAFQTDISQKTDAIIVLTGGKNRISEAVKLLNDGLGEKLLISGVAQKTSLQDLSKRNDIVILTQREITLDKRSTNTIENAIEAVEWARKNNIKSIRLVTSNYHILRSELEFQAKAPELEIILHPVYSENVSASWWRSPRSFCLVASEYNKFLIVWLRNHLKLV